MDDKPKFSQALFEQQKEQLTEILSAPPCDPQIINELFSFRYDDGSTFAVYLVALTDSDEDEEALLKVLESVFACLDVGRVNEYLAVWSTTTSVIGHSCTSIGLRLLLEGGRNLLHFSSKKKLHQICRFLLEHGATAVPDDAGIFASELCGSDPELRALFLQHGHPAGDPSTVLERTRALLAKQPRRTKPQIPTMNISCCLQLPDTCQVHVLDPNRLVLLRGAVSLEQCQELRQIYRDACEQKDASMPNSMSRKGVSMTLSNQRVRLDGVLALLSGAGHHLLALPPRTEQPVHTMFVAYDYNDYHLLQRHTDDSQWTLNVCAESRDCDIHTVCVAADGVEHDVVLQAGDVLMHLGSVEHWVTGHVDEQRQGHRLCLIAWFKN